LRALEQKREAQASGLAFELSERERELIDELG